MFNKFKATPKEVEQLTKLKGLVSEIFSENPSEQGENLLNQINTILGHKNQETNTEGKKEGEEENTRSRKELKVDMEKGKRMFGSFLMALEKNQADGYNKSDIEVFALWYSMGYGAALISSSKNGLLEAFEEKASFEKLLNE